MGCRVMRAGRYRFRADADAPRASHVDARLTPARLPVQRPADARLLVVDARGAITTRPRANWADLLLATDLVVANDAATIPARLQATLARTGEALEVRLAGHAPRSASGEPRFDAVLFGAGDWRTRTEERPAPPEVQPGDVLHLGSIDAVVEALLGHARLVRLRFAAGDAQVWTLLATRGRPVQYAHLAVDLAPWDVWTPIAGHPVAFEPPSAGFVLDWRSLRRLRERGIGFATLSHAAGLSSTGDSALDARLPLDEPYAIPSATARRIAEARARGGRIVAIGTTVVRALEHAARRDGVVRAGSGVADQRIGAGTPLRVVDALLTGTHERGASHHELLRAFIDDATLSAAGDALVAHAFRTHEFGDSMLVDRQLAAARRAVRA
jgi:S-adenosylmethionine:tRNA ribosyltransferase-isomerase